MIVEGCEGGDARSGASPAVELQIAAEVNVCRFSVRLKGPLTPCGHIGRVVAGFDVNVGIQPAVDVVILPTAIGIAHAPARGEEDLTVLDGGVDRVVEADGAAEQHGERLVLRNSDHVNLMVVGGGGVRRAARLARVNDAVAVGGADIDLNVEQPLVHGHGELFARRIGRGAVDADLAALLDPRSDQRDVAALLESVDLRAVLDADRRVGSRRAAKAGVEPVGRRAEVGDVVGGEQQATDVEHRGRSDDDSARGIKPHIAADLTALLQRGDHVAVKRDGLAACRSDAVENRIVRYCRRAGEGRRVAGRKEIDRPTARLLVRGCPVDRRRTGAEHNRFGARSGPDICHRSGGRRRRPDECLRLGLLRCQGRCCERNGGAAHHKRLTRALTADESDGVDH